MSDAKKRQRHLYGLGIIALSFGILVGAVLTIVGPISWIGVSAVMVFIVAVIMTPPHGEVYPPE